MFIKRFTSLFIPNLIKLNTIPKININIRYCSNKPNIKYIKDDVQYKKDDMEMEIIKKIIEKIYKKDDVQYKKDKVQYKKDDVQYKKNKVQYKKEAVQYILNTSKNVDDIYYCIMDYQAGNLLHTSMLFGCLTGLILTTYLDFYIKDLFSPLSFGPSLSVGIISTLSLGIGSLGFFKYLMIRQKNKMLLNPDSIIKIIKSNNRYYEYVGYYISYGIILGAFLCIFYRLN